MAQTIKIKVQVDDEGPRGCPYCGKRVLFAGWFGRGRRHVEREH